MVRNVQRFGRLRFGRMVRKVERLVIWFGMLRDSVVYG